MTLEQDGKRLAADSAVRYRETYLNLRAALFVLIAMLFISILIQYANSSFKFQTSISAYYYTGVHSVFVACLCGMGALLIVYRGVSLAEETLLNYAGFLAFVVAFVPTSYPGSVFGPGALPPPVELSISSGVENAILALFISGGLTVVAWLVLYAADSSRARRVFPVDRPGPVVWLARFAGAAVVAALLSMFAFATKTFYSYGHGTAAISLFAMLIAIVALNAGYRSRVPNTLARLNFRRMYKTLAILMSATIGAVFLVLGNWEHNVIFVEMALLLEFAAYWLLQTVETWGKRPKLADKPARPSRAPLAQ